MPLLRGTQKGHSGVRLVTAFQLLARSITHSYSQSFPQNLFPLSNQPISKSPEISFCSLLLFHFNEMPPVNKRGNRTWSILWVETTERHVWQGEQKVIRDDLSYLSFFSLEDSRNLKSDLTKLESWWRNLRNTLRQCVFNLWTY